MNNVPVKDQQRLFDGNKITISNRSFIYNSLQPEIQQINSEANLRVPFKDVQGRQSEAGNLEQRQQPSEMSKNTVQDKSVEPVGKPSFSETQTTKSTNATSDPTNGSSQNRGAIRDKHDHGKSCDLSTQIM